jgi:hypothetical protein
MNGSWMPGVGKVIDLIFLYQFLQKGIPKSSAGCDGVEAFFDLREWVAFYEYTTF